MPEQIHTVIAAAETERDRLLLRVMWATGCRVSEALALRRLDVHRDNLVMPNRKNPDQVVKRVFLPASELDLPGALLLWADDNNLARTAPLFFSRKRAQDGGLRAISRQQAWQVVKNASRRADVLVNAMRPSRDGAASELAPIHPHLFRHSRIRQIVRQTKSLPLAKRQAGWATLQLAYLSIGDEEAREMMRTVTE